MDNRASEKSVERSKTKTLLAVVFGAGVSALAVTALLISIFEHRQDAKVPFVRLVEVDETSADSALWAQNWPQQYDTYLRTADTERTQYGGSSAMPASRLESDPWLRRLYAGYAFSIDYREARGHAYMLYDQQVTERVTKAKQPGACLHCHASVIPTYRRLGLESMGMEADAGTLGKEFNWPAVMEGFRIAGMMDYHEAFEELLKTPDGNPGQRVEGNETSEQDPHQLRWEGHPVGCLDCHDPKTMQIRVTRPGFISGIAALASSDAPVPHLPSIERWRKGARERLYNPNTDADRQEMRSFVCGQCHVEYYCGPQETLFFPWNNGLLIEQIEATFEQHRFPDGRPFYDFEHGETGAKIFKAQHPEFELWSQGVHAQSGVSCSDCHMPYQRVGAMKVSSHWVKSPLLSINSSCQPCHSVSEAELKRKVENIQQKTKAQIDRAAAAMTDMLDAIREAQAAAPEGTDFSRIFDLQNKAMFRLDFINSENSLGFHADQEAMRILGESIDFSRQAQAAALRLRTEPVGELPSPAQGIIGVTPEGKAPASRSTPR